MVKIQIFHQLTSLTPKAFATPASDTSEFIGPNPPNKKTYKYKLEDQLCMDSGKLLDLHRLTKTIEGH